MPLNELFLIGDSHAVAIGRAASERGIRVLGGPLGTGKQLEANFFDIVDGQFTINESISAQNQNVTSQLDDFRFILDFDGPILSTIGFNTYRFTQDLHRYLTKNGHQFWEDAMSSQTFEQTVHDARSSAQNFYRSLAAHGKHVFFTHSPQIVPLAQHQTFLACEKILVPIIQETGATFVDIRAQLGPIDKIKEQYADTRLPMHANTAYGHLVLDRLEKMYP